MKHFTYHNGRLIKADFDVSENFFTKENFFETILIYKSTPIFLNDHVRRLLFSLKKFNYVLDKSLNEINIIAAIKQLLSDCPNTKYLRITVMLSGDQKLRPKEAIYFSTNEENFYPLEKYETGAKVEILNEHLTVNSKLKNTKGSYLKKNVFVRGELKKRDVDEGIFTDKNGFVAEGCASNIFWLKNGKLLTPPSELCFLPGITRQKVIDIASKANFEVAEGKYYINQLLEAEEVFLTNSLMGIMPVSRINDTLFAVKKSDITNLLINKYKEELLEQVRVRRSS